MFIIQNVRENGMNVKKTDFVFLPRLIYVHISYIHTVYNNILYIVRLQSSYPNKPINSIK